MRNPLSTRELIEKRNNYPAIGKWMFGEDKFVGQCVDIFCDYIQNRSSQKVNFCLDNYNGYNR